MITHASDNPVERQRKECQCSKCGTVAICTPEFDFYSKNVGDPLECETCFFAPFKGKITIDLRKPANH